MPPLDKIYMELLAKVDRLLKNKPIVIYGDGEQTRDFINIKVVVSAKILSMNANQQGAEVIQHRNTV